MQQKLQPIQHTAMQTLNLRDISAKWLFDSSTDSDVTFWQGHLKYYPIVAAVAI